MKILRVSRYTSTRFEKNKGVSHEEFQKQVEGIVKNVQEKETYESFHHPVQNKKCYKMISAMGDNFIFRENK